MSLTKSERRALSRLELGKKAGWFKAVHYLVEKGLAVMHEDGTVVTTEKGREALAEHRRAA